MPLDFPNSPTNGQIFTSGIKKWQYSTAEGSWLASNYAPSPENVDGIVKCNGAGTFSAAVAGTDYLTSGSTMVAKAWGVFDGVAPVSILGSYNINIAGIARTARGKYTITFQNPMTNTNYAIVVTSSPTTGSSDGWNMPVYHIDGKTVNDVDVFFGSANTGAVYWDSTQFSIAVFAS